ncbi:MAG: AzlC family ABC transporter permease [Oscillospiraceae bacterium]|nr:AzlC family ABC transporter permease [Oscillospiraceae bacterium]
MMEKKNSSWFFKGMRDGMPICLGYLAVAFTLGIAAKNAGLTPLQAGTAAFLTNASAGGYAGFTVIAEQASYIEMAVMILIANARYLLMSASLSQKLAPDIKWYHRLLIGFDVTDEIFGVCIAVPGKLKPAYAYGVFSVAIPGWAVGTYLGVMMGNLFSPSIVSALSVGLYGMFIAIIIPPAKKDRVIAALIIISMALSYAFAAVPLFDGISSGIKVIILTVVISAAAAYFFPVKEDRDAA